MAKRARPVPEVFRLTAEEAALLSVELHWLAGHPGRGWLRALADYVAEAGKHDGAFIRIAPIDVKVAK